MEIKDEEIRKQLSGILDSYGDVNVYKRVREVKILSWIEIAYEIGKLKKE